MKARWCLCFSWTWFFLILSLLSGHTQPVVPLHWLNPSTQENDLYGVTYGNGKFVAVGNLGTTLSSTDGTNWQGNYAPIGAPLNGVCYGNGSFVAVGSNGVILTSIDGVNWSNMKSPTTSSLHTAVFGNNVFVVGGDNGTIISSTDGATWTIRPSGISNPLTSIVYANNMFIGISVGSGSNQTQCASSRDGTNWTPSSIPAVPVDGFGVYSSVTYGNGRFLSPGCSTNNRSLVAFSTNGSDWTAYELPQQHWLTVVYPTVEVQYGAGQFVVIQGNYAISSSDGTNWNTSAIGTGFWLSAVCFGANEFVGVGPHGWIADSYDGQSWVRVAPTSASIHNDNLSGLAASTNVIVAVGQSAGSTSLLVSTNSGVSWQDNNNAGPLSDVAYGNGLFMAVGLVVGPIAVSPDGLNWTNFNYMVDHNLNRVIFANGTFMIVTGNGDLIESSNGSVLTAHATGYSGSLNGVTYGAGNFVVVANAGTVRTSPDGNTWSSQSSGVTNNLFNVAYGNGQFVAVGQSGSIISSPDGNHWSVQHSGVTSDIVNVFFGNGIFGAVTYAPYGNLLLTSVDGTNWFPVVLPTPYGYATATPTPSGFLFAGAGAAIAGTGSLPRLLAASSVSGQGFQLSFYGNSNQVYTIQRSANATNWADVISFTNSRAPYTFVDVLTSSPPNQFYRVVSP